jgi:hypothetical protein
MNAKVEVLILRNDQIALHCIALHTGMPNREEGSYLQSQSEARLAQAPSSQSQCKCRPDRALG